MKEVISKITGFDTYPLLAISKASLCPGGGMVDAQVSGTCGSNTVEVRVLFWAPNIFRKNI
jgi:hypothetical protein